MLCYNAITHCSIYYFKGDVRMDEKSFREELSKQEYWDITFDKMTDRPGVSDEDMSNLWAIKEAYRYDIINKLMSGEYEWELPRRVEIAKSGSSNKRVVYVYSLKERYILGVLYRAISNYFSDRIGFSCFSYKRGVGTCHAMQYIKDNMTEEFMYGLKVDIHAYFNSVNKDRVVSIINELFTGGFKVTMEKLLLTDKVIWRGKEFEEYKALIPGCALGSFLANYCLIECDKFFEEQVQLGNCIYARYSDDIIILAKSKEALNEYSELINEHIKLYGLEINPEKYTWFEPGDSVEYLGLKLFGNGQIDISDHAKQKIKKQIHRWCKKGRVEIERDNKPFDEVARKIIKRLNNKNFKCFINHDTSFGWCAYAFNKITTEQSLREIDIYTRDSLRALKTGRHNKNNRWALSDKQLEDLGWVSIVDLYRLYKRNFDYYCEVIELL